MRWLDKAGGALVFARDPGFIFAANLGTTPLRLPPHQEVLLASGPLHSDGSLPRDTAIWLQT
jgi:alpha-glucosidase